MAVDVPELDQPGSHGLLRTRWFPLAMTEPATFMVIMLIAVSHYATVHGTEDMKLKLLHLRYEALQAINKKLSLGPEAIDDALIGSVSKIASYEAMFGSLDNFKLHMQGLIQMIHLRGGLSSLGLGGLLRRIVIWVDHNSAFLYGLSPYFPFENFNPGEVSSHPNPGQFLAAS